MAETETTWLQNVLKALAAKVGEPLWITIPGNVKIVFAANIFVGEAGCPLWP